MKLSSALKELREKASTPGAQRVVNFMHRLVTLSRGKLAKFSELRRIDRGIQLKWSGAPIVTLFFSEDSDDVFWEVDCGAKSLGARITSATPHIPQILEEALKGHYAGARQDFKPDLIRQYVG